MKKQSFVVLIIIVVASLVSLVSLTSQAQAQEQAQPQAQEERVTDQPEVYPADVLEKYWQCRERTDLDLTRKLLTSHREERPIDATIYGLPENDFDDTTLLTIEERLMIRTDKEAHGIYLPTSGPLQYPHHLRYALDHLYEMEGSRPDCSEILSGEALMAYAEKTLDAGWSNDLNLTSGDSASRGEVDIAIDFADPSRIVATSVGAGGETSNHIARTSDFGQTWSSGQVGNNSGSSWECDPVSYYQRDSGKLYHSKIGCSNGSCSQTYTMMRVSSNNGANWSDCARPGVQTSEDRQWHVVDNTPSSSCYGNIYVTWHNSNQQIVATSSNDCSSWTGRTNLTSTYQAITPDISVGADGHAYVVWQNHGDATFKISGSDDCGSTWTSPSPKTLKARMGDWSNGIPAQCQRGVPTQPNVDVDRCTWSDNYGRVYVVMQDFNQSCATQGGWSCSTWDSNWNNTCNFDFYLMYSDNGGSTWSTPVNITQGDGNLVDHFLGYMRVDEADGSIYITFQRSRLNPSSAADRQKTHFMIMRSIDGGATWQGPLQASSYEGNERLSGASTFERGDYAGFSVFDGVVWPVWVDRRGGSGEEEIITRKVCTEPSHRSERAPSFAAPATVATPGSGQQINISWSAPDAYWGDGGEDTASRKYQLYVDGSLAQDNISWTSGSTTYAAADCTTSHSFFIRAFNSCGTTKDYASVGATATGCSGCNPSVDVSPNGPLALCGGDGQSLSVAVNGGTGPFTYQWTRDGSNISGATGTSYYAADSGSHSYNCLVTGSGTGCTAVQDTSAVAITWEDAPSFAGLQTVTASPSSTCTLALGWNAGTACAGTVTYNVYRSTLSTFTPAVSNRIGTGVNGTSYTDVSGLIADTTYYYVVRGVANSTEETNTIRKSGAPIGPVTSGTWADDLEPSADSGWTHAADQGTDDWALSTASSHSSSHSWMTVDVASLADKSLVAPAKGLSSSSVLTFWHTYDFESGYDGGVLEISTDNGSNWSDLGAAMTAGGYVRTLSTSYQNPIGGRDSWSGAQASFVQVSVNLGSYAGVDRLIRWRAGCDSSVGAGNWHIDDIQITNTEVYGTCGGVTCDPPTFAGLISATDVNGCADTGVDLSWGLPSAWGDDGSGTRRFDVLRGGVVIASLSSSTTAYVDLDAPDSVSLSYSVLAVNGCGSDSTGGVTRSVTNADSEPAPSFSGLQSVSNSGTTDLVLAWNVGSAACGTGVRYNVYRSTSSSFTPGASTRIASNRTSTSYTDAGLADGTYYYIVRAEDYTSGHSGPNGGVEDSNTTTRSGTISTSIPGGDWLDDLEPSADAGWTHSAAQGSDDWALSTTSSNSPTHSWASEDVDVLADKSVVSPAQDVSATSVLTFYHKYDFESGYDGGVLEISVAGGAWTDLGSSATSNGYTNTISSSYSSPISGRSAWSGSISSFAEVSVDLGAYAGQSAQIRWRMGCDSSVGKGFWYVDDIQITDVGTTPSECTTPTFGGISSATDVNGCATTGISLSWSAPSDWGDDASGTRDFDILRGGAVIAAVTSSTTSYIDYAAPVGSSQTYAIRANNGCGDSSDGGTSRSATNYDTEAAPSFAGLSSVVAGASCDLVLSWNSGSAACGSGVRYNVYRSISSGFTPGSSNRIATGLSSTTYSDDGVVDGTYYYVVRAEDNTTGHSGPNGGVEETNTIERSGTVSGGASSTVTLFDDSFDSGVGLNGWGSGQFVGTTVGWRGIQSCSANSGSGIFRFGGTSCTSNYGNDKFTFVNPGGTTGIVIPGDASDTTLNFWHRWAFETRYDGATMMISTDGSSYTYVPASAISSGSYTHTTSTYCAPEGGGDRAIWSGTKSTFTNTIIDLDAAANAISGNTGGAAGKTLWIAFAVITDCSTTGDGWFFDDVMVTATTGSSCGSAALLATGGGDHLPGDSIKVMAHFDYPAVDLSYEEPIDETVIIKE